MLRSWLVKELPVERLWARLKTYRSLSNGC